MKNEVRLYAVSNGRCAVLTTAGMILLRAPFDRHHVAVELPSGVAPGDVVALSADGSVLTRDGHAHFLDPTARHWIAGGFIFEPAPPPAPLREARELHQAGPTDGSAGPPLIRSRAVRGFCVARDADCEPGDIVHLDFERTRRLAGGAAPSIVILDRAEFERESKRWEIIVAGWRG